MTLHQIEAQIGALAGREVRLRPDLARAPYVWEAALRGAARPVAQIAADLGDVGASSSGDRLVVTLGDDQVATALDDAATSVAPDALVVPDRRVLTLTRDGGREVSFAGLVDEVGEASARWAVLRSSDGHRIDCAAADLATLTPRNPLLPVLLAATRLDRGTPSGAGAERAAALTGQWPQVVRAAGRDGRTRPVARFVEAAADAMLTWTEQPPGADVDATRQFAPWTGERLARAGRIVLVAGLAVAGIAVPARI